MTTVVIWESRFQESNAPEGVRLTQAIWADMPSFEGYLSHELLADDDDPGHLLLISRWESRAHADASLRSYSTHANVVAVNELVSEPRQRTVAHPIEGPRITG